MQDQNFIDESEVQKWIDQGRDEEHIYAVRNFLTGQGAVMIKRLLQKDRQEIVDRLNQMINYTETAEMESEKYADDRRNIINEVIKILK